MKGTEKFWDNPEGAEAILQVRAAVLSDDDRLTTHIQARPGSAFRGSKRRVTGKLTSTILTPSVMAWLTFSRDKPLARRLCL